MRIEYALSEQGFLEAQRLHGGWSFRLLPIIGGLLMLGGIFRLVQDPKHLANGIAPLLLGAALASTRRLQLSYTYRQDKRLHDPYTVTVSDEGIEVSGPTGSSTHDWKAFTTYVESKNLFVLYQGPASFNIFPKRSFGLGEADAFRILVQQKLNLGGRMARKGLSPVAWIFILMVAVAFILMLLVIRNAMRQSSLPPLPAQTQPANS
jgi:hypothetical protein